jgi:acetyltransferase
MIGRTKGYKLLNGFRGRPEADIDRLERLVVCLSDLAVDHPCISEMDINPLIVHPKGEGATVADCRMILDGEQSGYSPNQK